MSKVVELEKELQQLKLTIEKEKMVLKDQKLTHTSLSHERDRKLLRDFFPGVVEDQKGDFKSVDASYVQFVVDGEKFVSFKKNFEGIKEGLLTLENITKESPCRIENITAKNFRIILEHVRNDMKLKHIGIPDSLDGRIKLLQDVRTIGGLDKLKTRLEVLCFIQSLDTEDSVQKEQRIMKDLEILRHEMNLIRTLRKKQEEINKNIETELSEEKKPESKELDFGKPVMLYVGGDAFPCYLNQCIKPYENSRLVELIKKQDSSSEPILIDRDKRMFQKVHDFVYSPSKFLSSCRVSFDEQSLFNETMQYFLGNDNVLDNPFYRSGEENLRMLLEEDLVRTMFVKDRKNKVLEKKDLLLMSIFDSKREEFQAVPNDRVHPLPFLFNVEGDPNEFLPQIRQHTYLPPVVDTFSDFKRNFKTFTSHLLEGLDYSNVFVAGGSVLANVLDYSVPNKAAVKKKKGPKPKPFMFMMRQQQKQQMESKDKGKENLGFNNMLNSFKMKERLTNFSETNLDSQKTSPYVSLLNVPISPLLLKRLISLRADITSASGFKKNPDAKYNGFEVPDSMQFLKGLMFHQNKFTFQTPRLDHPITFRFIVGSESIPEHFKMIPKDLYPIGLSEDQGYLFFTTLSTPYEQDFPVYVLQKDGKDWPPSPLSSLISQLKPVDEILDDPSGMMRRHRHFSKSDIDLFVYGTSVEEAKAKVKHIYETVCRNIMKQEGTIRDVLVIRTAYSVTFQFHKRRPIQLVLRLYKSPAEILAGFDIDSCCIGYDGEKVLCLPRFRRALTHRYNLINVERQSTTYELRLYKYARRGFRVAIPGYSPSLVKREGLLKSDLSETKWKSSKNLFADPTYLNTCGLARLLVLEGKLKRKLKAPMAIMERSDYDGAFLTIPARLRRANPKFVFALLKEKEMEIQKKMEMLVEYAGYKKDQKWKSPMVYCLNNVEPVILNPHHSTCQLSADLTFLTENPGTQEKITGSFRPVKVNFFSGAYLSFSQLVEERWKEGLGKYQWWYSADGGATLAAFSSHQNLLMEEARNGKMNALKTRSVIVDFESESCFFVKDQEKKKYKIFRKKDFKVPK